MFLTVTGVLQVLLKVCCKCFDCCAAAVPAGACDVFSWSYLEIDLVPVNAVDMWHAHERMSAVLGFALSIAPPFFEHVPRGRGCDVGTQKAGEVCVERVKKVWSVRGRNVVQHLMRCYLQDSSSAHLVHELLL